MTRKAGILGVATELFRAQGKSHTSIRQIASRASVSHSLLHKHWVSKDDLYLDCLASEVSALAEIIAQNGGRVELTVYYLLKHPVNWSLVARCLSMSPPSTGEEKRFEAKMGKLLDPLMDSVLLISREMTTSQNTNEVEKDQIGKTWFFLIMSIFSGHCLIQRTLRRYMGDADLKAARRITIDAFYENCVFNRKELLR